MAIRLVLSDQVTYSYAAMHIASWFKVIVITFRLYNKNDEVQIVKLDQIMVISYVAKHIKKLSITSLLFKCNLYACLTV